MSDPDNIAKLVALVDKAVARIHPLPSIQGGAQDGALDAQALRDARDELWVAADWINRRDAADRADYVSAIFEDKDRAYFFTINALLQIATLDEQIENIQDGVPWEAEGERFQAFTQLEIQVLKGEVPATIENTPQGHFPYDQELD